MINSLLHHRGATILPAQANHQEEDGINSIKKSKISLTKRRAVATVALASFVVVLSLFNYIGTQDKLQRFLTANLGGGKCKWQPPQQMENTTNPLNTTTLLASYPGSGKRLTWRMLEALTGESVDSRRV